MNEKMDEYEIIPVKIKKIEKKKHGAIVGTLYDLEVENDESYIAGRIVVHNSSPYPYMEPAINTVIRMAEKKEL